MLIPIILAMVLEFNQGNVSYLNSPKIVLMVDHLKCMESKTVSQLTITEIDQGKTFRVRSGDVIVINLAENPTTGYRWEINTIDSNIIELQNSEFSPPKNTILGSGGERIYTFKTKATGIARLQFKEWRPWEGDRSIVKQFSVTLQINY